MTNRIAIAILEAIIDDKTLKGNQKELLKNILIPMIEYIEDSESPQETITNAHRLLTIVGVANAIGLTMAVRPERYEEAASRMAGCYMRDLMETVQMLEAAKQAHVMANTGNTP